MDAGRYSIIARCLQSASGALPPDQEGKLCLIKEDENDLMEMIMEGSNLVNQDYITSGVKTNTPAAYLYQEFAQRRVFCVSEEDILKCYSYDANESTWSEVDLGPAAGQQLHPESGLCACFNPEGIRVYFQDPSGSLRGIALQNGTWTELGTVPAKPARGTPLSIAFSNSTFYLYYMNADGYLHYLNMAIPDGKWKDNLFPESKFTTTVDKFMAFRGETEAEMEAYFLSSNKITRVDVAGTRSELGSIEGGVFVPNKTEQCWSVCYIPVLVYRPCCCYCW